MRESPPIRVGRYDLDSSERSPLPYVAALFKGTLQAFPGATLSIIGNGMIASKAQEKLERTLDVPRGKIRIVQVADPRYQDSVNMVIVYFPAAAGRRTVWVEFKLDLESLPIKVEFEVSPDGAYVEEVKAQWAPLKAIIKKHALAGRVQKIKIATKVEGLALFDRPTSDKVETALKAKIKAALSADVRLPGTQKMINVELYGATSAKFKGDNVKAIYEGGVMLTVPFDLF